MQRKSSYALSMKSQSYPDSAISIIYGLNDGKELGPIETDADSHTAGRYKARGTAATVTKYTTAHA